jgi:type IV pilus assembly protein PilX
MHSRTINFSKSKQRQRGTVLITAVIFMIVLMLLGISLVGSTSSDEKMARNARDADVAFAAAEAALRDAELQITGAYQWPYKPVSLYLFDTSCSNGLCDSTSAPPATQIDLLDFFGASAPGSKSVAIGTVTTSPAIANVLDQPRYLIELVCSSLGTQTGSTCGKVFRITAQAHGRLPNTKVVLQEIYLPSDFVN